MVNDNLEQQAQTLYRAWFEDFIPYKGELPTSWTKSTLGEITDIKTNIFSPVKNPNIELEHYSIPAFDELHYPVFESAENIKSNKYIVNTNSVMISKLNPDTKRIWRPQCLTEQAVCSTEFIVYEPLCEAYKDFVYSIIDSNSFSNWLCSHTTGSTNSRQRATPKSTLEFEINLPDKATILQFCSLVTPLYDYIASNICENQRLSNLRDILLPKLMSEEINAFDINI